MPDRYSERRAIVRDTRVLCVVSEIAGAAAGVVDAWRVVPTWCLQATLLVLFSWAGYAGRQVSRARQVMA